MIGLVQHTNRPVRRTGRWRRGGESERSAETSESKESKKRDFFFRPGIGQWHKPRAYQAATRLTSMRMRSRSCQSAPWLFHVQVSPDNLTTRHATGSKWVDG